MQFKETFENYHGQKNFPFVYLGINFIGGNKELKKLNETGELDKLIKEYRLQKMESKKM